VRYHTCILPVRDRIVAVRFEQVTSDFGVVVERVNAAFGTGFGVFAHTPENEGAVLAAIERRNLERWGEEMTPERARSLARPTAERAAKKERLRAQLEAPELASLRAQAVDLHRTLVGSAAAVSA
jgi:hypothetical protein